MNYKIGASVLIFEHSSQTHLFGKITDITTQGNMLLGYMCSTNKYNHDYFMYGREILSEIKDLTKLERILYDIK